MGVTDWTHELCPECGYSKSSKEHRGCYKKRYREDGRLQTSHKKDYNKRKHTIKYRLRQLKRSAAKRNIEFSLRPEDIVIPEYCPVLGIKLSLTNTKVANNSPSVDRFDNNKGYVKDNVRVISYRANVLKRDATIEELEAVIRYMKS